MPASRPRANIESEPITLGNLARFNQVGKCLSQEIFQAMRERAKFGDPDRTISDLAAVGESADGVSGRW